MRVLFATFGSLGDLHPKIALALGMQRRGHDVTLATSEPYREKIEALGLPFRPLRPDLSLNDDALVRRIMKDQTGSRYLMRRLVYPAIREMHADLAPLAAQADLLVGGELACAVPIIGEQTGRRWVYCALSPVSFLPLHDPSVVPGPPLAVQPFRPAANRAVLWLARLFSYSWWRPVRALRRELGLPPGPSPLFQGKMSPHLNLAAFSPVLQPPQRDWPAHTVQTGFLFHDEPETSAALPPTVRQFLDAGEPPLVFTLGSAAVKVARDFYEQSAAAARALGRRAVLLLGKNPPPPNLPSSILAWDYLPYARIFPHASAIVHQGGVGTTAQALRAGRPMLVIPFAFDQPDNAARVTRLGVGRTLARRACRPARVAHELDALLSDPAFARRAAGAGERIRAEDGVANACDALERVV